MSSLAMRQPTRETKLRLFVDAWFATGFDGEAAALSVGAPPASAKTWASRQLSTEVVRAMIKVRVDELAEQHTVTPGKLINELSHIAFHNVADFTKIDVNGERYFTFEDSTREQMSTIAELTVDRYTEGRGDEAKEVKRTKVKFHSKPQAIETLLRVMGQFKGKEDGGVNLTVNNNTQTNTVQITKDQAAEAMQKLLQG